MIIGNGERRGKGEDSALDGLPSPSVIFRTGWEAHPTVIVENKLPHGLLMGVVKQLLGEGIQLSQF